MTTTTTPCTCDLSHEICLGGAECGKKIPPIIPPGVIKVIHTCDDGTHFESPTYFKECNKYGCKVHTICVDGKRWSVGDKEENGTIQSFKYSDLSNRWIATVKLDYITSDFFVSELSKLPSPTTGKDSGEEKGLHKFKSAGELVDFYLGTKDPSEWALRWAMATAIENYSSLKAVMKDGWTDSDMMDFGEWLHAFWEGKLYLKTIRWMFNKYKSKKVKP